jgi:hypothetical protein
MLPIRRNVERKRWPITGQPAGVLDEERIVVFVFAHCYRYDSFDPVWRQRFTFPLREPRTAMLLFRVMNVENTTERLIGIRCAPVTLLMPGYRSVFLYDVDNSTVLPESSLLVQIGLKTNV